MDARLHCVDLDTAYNQVEAHPYSIPYQCPATFESVLLRPCLPTQGAKKLERALMSIRELQNSLRDGVILFRALLEELRRNMDEERQGIVMSYESLHNAIKQTYDSLLTSLDSQYNTTDRFETFDHLHLKMISRIWIITMTIL